jgi:hypothetical protein
MLKTYWAVRAIRVFAAENGDYLSASQPGRLPDRFLEYYPALSKDVERKVIF